MANPVYFYQDDNYFECEPCEVAIHSKETFQLLEHTLAFHDLENIVTECTICSQEFIGFGNIFQHIKKHVQKIQPKIEENIFKADSKFKTETNDPRNENHKDKYAKASASNNDSQIFIVIDIVVRSLNVRQDIESRRH